MFHRGNLFYRYTYICMWCTTVDWFPIRERQSKYSHTQMSIIDDVQNSIIPSHVTDVGARFRFRYRNGYIERDRQTDKYGIE